MSFPDFREWRHSRCLMTPFSTLLILLLSIFSLLLLILQFPGFVIGLFVAPIASRGNWFVQFLYPFPIARWGHLKLLRWGSKSKNGVIVGEEDNGMRVHSRCVESRTEVVQGRVYIHPLPQLLDNVGYLIVCVPPDPPEVSESSKDEKANNEPIIGIIVDIAETDVVLGQIEAIQQAHYADLPCEIEIHAIISTHKHHDHTAGNGPLSKHAKHGKTLKYIFGGAVEQVPFCNSHVTNGHFIPLPFVGSNDMNDVASIEAIAAPSHTRGSVVFALRNKTIEGLHSEFSMSGGSGGDGVYSYLFTGDTMFSGGAGVPFEADIEFPKDVSVESKKSSSPFKPNAGSLSLERIFAEILNRSIDDRDITYSGNGKVNVGKQVMIFPGHEYTLDLLQRQFQGDAMQLTNSSWNRHNPSTFFELASQLFISGHRRHLPKSTRILTVPSTLQRELTINPYYRSIRKRGEHILSAINIWYKFGNRKGDIKTVNQSETTYLTMPRSKSGESIFEARQTLKSVSTETSWNTNYEDINKPVFTTVYAEDLNRIIDQLNTGRLDNVAAAYHLSKLSEKLEQPLVQRRPVPNTFSSEKKMYLGLLAMAILGSPPSCMTSSDSKKMNMPAPVKSSDFLMISKKRLISSLFRLDLLVNCSNIHDLENNDMIQIINLLWEEARAEFEGLQLNDEQSDLEVQKEDNDLLELGALKLLLYAVPYNRPSWFSKFCMPCDEKEKVRYIKSSERVETMKLKKRSGGELVRHDIGKCPLCHDILGAPPVEPMQASSPEKSPMNMSSPFNRPRSPTTKQEGFELSFSPSTSPSKQKEVLDLSIRRPRTSPIRKQEGFEMSLRPRTAPTKRFELKVGLNRPSSKSPTRRDGYDEGVEMKLSPSFLRN